MKYIMRGYEVVSCSKCNAIIQWSEMDVTFLEYFNIDDGITRTQATILCPNCNKRLLVPHTRSVEIDVNE